MSVEDFATKFGRLAKGLQEREKPKRYPVEVATVAEPISAIMQGLSEEQYSSSLPEAQQRLFSWLQGLRGQIIETAQILQEMLIKEGLQMQSTRDSLDYDLDLKGLQLTGFDISNLDQVNVYLGEQEFAQMELETLDGGELKKKVFKKRKTVLKSRRRSRFGRRG